MTGTGRHVLYLHIYMLQSTIIAIPNGFKTRVTFHRDYFSIKGEQGELLQSGFVTGMYSICMCTNLQLRIV